MLIEHAIQLSESGTMSLDDRRYPITRIEKYVNPGSLTGVASDTSVDLSTKYAIVLRNEFVPAGKRSGDEEFPVRDIYCKVLPLACQEY